MGNLLTAMGAPEAQQAINTTMTEMENRPWREEQRGMQREQFTGSQAVNKMQLEEHQIRLDQAKKQQEFMNEPVDYGQQLKVAGFSDTTISFVTDGLKKMKILDEKGFGSRGKVLMATKQAMETKELMNNVLNIEIDERSNVRNKAYKRLEKAREDGNRADIKVAQDEYEKAEQELGKIAGAKGEYNKGMEAKIKMDSAIQELKSSGAFETMPASVVRGLKSAYLKRDDKLFNDIYKEYVKGAVKPEKQYEPHQYMDKNGKPIWVEPGQTPPPGAKPYVAPSVKERTFKDQQIEKMWPTLSEDERKKVLGAGVDPHELTQKNLLDVYANIMTSPDIKKALQPIVEKIIKEAAEGKKNKPQIQKVINQLPSNAKFHGYAEDGKKIYIVPPATKDGKSTYIKEQ